MMFLFFDIFYQCKVCWFEQKQQRKAVMGEVQSRINGSMPEDVQQHFARVFMRSHSLGLTLTLDSILSYLEHGETYDIGETFSQLTWKTFLSNREFDPDYLPFDLRQGCVHTLADFNAMTLGVKLKSVPGREELWKGSINGCEVVLKIGGKEVVAEAIMMTIMTHPKMLECAQAAATNRLNVEGFDQFPIALPLFVVRDRQSYGEGARAVYAMESMEGTLADFMSSPPIGVRPSHFIDIVLQVMQWLAILQSAFHFMHRNLDLRSVLLKRRPLGEVTVLRRLGKTKLKLTSLYKVAFADVGSACCDLSACGFGIELNNSVKHMFPSYRTGSSEVPCRNPSFDCITFIAAVSLAIDEFGFRIKRREDLVNFWTSVTQEFWHGMAGVGLDFAIVKARGIQAVYENKSVEELVHSRISPNVLFNQTVRSMLDTFYDGKLQVVPREDQLLAAQQRRIQVEFGESLKSTVAWKMTTAFPQRIPPVADRSRRS